jgi:flagellar biosynthesis GTPase FlhF
MKITADLIQATMQNFTRQGVSNKPEESAPKSASFEFKMPKFDPIASRKSAAKGKLDMLKRQLDGMLKFAGIGKSNVAAAARLAKQIAAAVAEYAGLNGGGAVQSPTIAGASNPPSAKATTENSEQSTEHAGQEAEQAVQKAEQAAKVQEEKQSKASESSSTKSNLSAEDRDFLDEAKKIMQKAKLLLALELQNSKKEIKTDKALYKDAVNSMDNALKNAIAALEQEGKAQSTDTPSVYSADGHTSPIQVSLPQISVQA